LLNLGEIKRQTFLPFFRSQRKGTRKYGSKPGCLFRILIFFQPGSRIQQQQNGGKICFPSFFCNYKFHKILNDFIFKKETEKKLTN